MKSYLKYLILAFQWMLVKGMVAKSQLLEKMKGGNLIATPASAHGVTPFEMLKVNPKSSL